MLIRSLVVWPAVFASVVLATFLAAVVVLDADPGGPLGWPILWIVGATAYSAVAGIPLAICARRRRWYLRLIPAVTAAVPVVWIAVYAGVWVIPGALTIAVTILVETVLLRPKD